MFDFLENLRKSLSKRINGDDRSFAKVSEILNKLNLTLLDDWKGRSLNGKLLPYKVCCNVCGTVYETYLHCNTIKCCPCCKTGRFIALRKGRVKNLIESEGFECFQNVSHLIKSPKGRWLEIDLFVPELRIAFEFNGYYSPVEGAFAKNRDYHKYKTEECLKLGIRLYHIWEDISDLECVHFIGYLLNRKPGFSISYCVRDVNDNYVRYLYKNNIIFAIFYNVKGDFLYIICDNIAWLRIDDIFYLRLQLIGFAQYLKCKRIIATVNRDFCPDPYNNFYTELGFKYLYEGSYVVKYHLTKPRIINGILYKSNTVLRSLETTDLTGIHKIYNSGTLLYGMDVPN